MVSIKSITFKPLTLSVLSGCLLVFAYPTFDYAFIAWFALIPLLFALKGKDLKHSFWLAYVAGVLFFSGTLYWFIHVTKVGTTLLILFLSLYFGLFGIWVYVNRRQSDVFQLFSLPIGWVCLEYLRSHLFSGFGWVLMGHSQYNFYPIIQIAKFTGVYGVSFLVMLLTVGMAQFIAHHQSNTHRFRVTLIICGLIALTVLGIKPMTSMVGGPSVLVVQPNIDQDIKWIPHKRREIVDKHLRISSDSLPKDSDVDLVIWPETAFPGLTWQSPLLMEKVRAFSKIHEIPLLFGAITERQQQYYNSAIMVSKEGNLGEHYDKLHLVPFGEFVPFRDHLPFLADWMGIEDFTSGTKPTIFTADSAEGSFPFGVLICFEDTLPYLARQLTNSGASFLVNMTNDGWFKNTKAPYLHWQSAVFRAVENNRPLVRAANTGVTGVIDRYGREQQVFQKGGLRSYVSGGMVLWVDADQNSKKTFYTKYGDVFTGICFLCILGCIIYIRRNTNKLHQGDE